MARYIIKLTNKDGAIRFYSDKYTTGRALVSNKKKAARVSLRWANYFINLFGGEAVKVGIKKKSLSRPRRQL